MGDPLVVPELGEVVLAPAEGEDMPAAEAVDALTNILTEEASPKKKATLGTRPEGKPVPGTEAALKPPRRPKSPPRSRANRAPNPPLLLHRMRTRHRARALPKPR
ncbi:hypothetical protein ACFSHQ_14025 [Gemmobacter lanyuensis]